MDTLDVIVIGGGPAGLSAALTLGRARRRVLLVDGGTPRNARAHEVHTFVTRDGTPPKEFRRVAREQLAPYTTVAVREGLVTAAKADGDGFVVSVGDASIRARRLLLAVGVVDQPPAIEGMAEHWGTSAFQCPYCHGFEAKDVRWGALVTTDALAEWSLMLLGWTKDLVVFTGGAPLAAETLARYAAAGVTVEQEPIAALSGDTRLDHVRVASGRRVPCGVLFVRPAQRQVALVDALELERDESGYVRVEANFESSRKGIFVAGDASTMMQSAIHAAATGSIAAAMMNHGLVMEDVAAASHAAR